MLHLAAGLGNNTPITQRCHCHCHYRPHQSIPVAYSPTHPCTCVLHHAVVPGLDYTATAAPSSAYPAVPVRGITVDRPVGGMFEGLSWGNWILGLASVLMPGVMAYVGGVRMCVHMRVKLCVRACVRARARVCVCV